MLPAQVLGRAGPSRAAALKAGLSPITNFFLHTFQFGENTQNDHGGHRKGHQAYESAPSLNVLRLKTKITKKIGKVTFPPAK